eukprot:CAMPEP_0118880954 /NCGR_PEP_ID=MMETSP1163-20130328/20459_1 /TAXON_ID=124430 /ORGANISM="Phaeomonas parva, Strain CCMP2877" /LENGTH=51 /DNA_ID=CAMNT_0006817567 /DNA_START=734 /DNA_END=889 /DNA_ORIENTATION=+
MGTRVTRHEHDKAAAKPLKSAGPLLFDVAGAPDGRRTGSPARRRYQQGNAH